MMLTVKEFMAKMFSLQKGVVVWLQILMLVNMIIPLFFLEHLEAKLVLVAFMINFMTGVILYKNFGFTRILGLMHWAWIPLCIFLISQCNSISMGGFYSIWIKSVIVLNGVSLLFDVKDVIEYLQGNHKLLNE